MPTANKIMLFMGGGGKPLIQHILFGRKEKHLLGSGPYFSVSSKSRSLFVFPESRWNIPEAADWSGVSHRETLSNPSVAHRCAFAQQDGDQNLLGSTLAQSGQLIRPGRKPRSPHIPDEDTMAE